MLLFLSSIFAAVFVILLLLATLEYSTAVYCTFPKLLPGPSPYYRIPVYTRQLWTWSATLFLALPLIYFHRNLVLVFFAFFFLILRFIHLGKNDNFAKKLLYLFINASCLLSIPSLLVSYISPSGLVYIMVDIFLSTFMLTSAISMSSIVFAYIAMHTSESLATMIHESHLFQLLFFLALPVVLLKFLPYTLLTTIPDIFIFFIFIISMLLFSRYSLKGNKRQMAIFSLVQFILVWFGLLGIHFPYFIYPENLSSFPSFALLFLLTLGLVEILFSIYVIQKKLSKVEI